VASCHAKKSSYNTTPLFKKMKQTQSHTLWDNNARGKGNKAVIIKSKFVITTPNCLGKGKGKSKKRREQKVT
jgi:hypothetical protein